MNQSLETDRRQRVRDGIFETLGDITYAILRKYEVANTSPASAIAIEATTAKA